jgi:hypothetical protein
MPELLTIVSGIASFAQILDCATQTCGTIAVVCKDTKDAPIELKRIKDKLDTLRQNLEHLREYLETLGDEVVLPVDLSYTLMSAITRVCEDVKAVESECVVTSLAELHSMRRRLGWALVEKRKTDILLRRLRGSEAQLDNALQLTNLCV